MGPHDKAFRALMKEEGAAEALLRERLPRATVRRFAGPPEALPESFVDESLRASVADLLLRVPLRGGEETFVYFLLEHKRTDAATVMLQLLRYLAQIYERLGRTHRGRTLPAVVPVVVYNGERPWRGPRRFSEVLEVSRELKHLTVDFGVVLVDLGAEPLERISAHRTLNGGLLGLRVAAVSGPEQGPAIHRAIAALAHDPSTLRLFLQYLLQVAKRTALPLLQQAIEEERNPKEQGMQTIAGYLESKGYRRGARKGLKKGLKEGLEKGREEGREDGLRLAVRQVLLRRFKRVSTATEAKIAAGELRTLQTWLDRALTARSLKQVFSDD